MRITCGLSSPLREALADAGRVGFVPTMGALHEGHLDADAPPATACDTVVTSVFVNPTQFNDQIDLAAYPRDEARDAHLADSAGTDLLFVPAVEEMYPQGYATTVSVRGVSEPLEGAHRGAAHFDGVATVVAKLLIAVAPDVAYFGQKDAQQVAVVRRLVADLGLPVEIAVCATVREPDGLAMSSRNVRLGPDDRLRALALKAGLEAASAAALAGGRRSPRRRARRGWTPCAPGASSPSTSPSWIRTPSPPPRTSPVPPSPSSPPAWAPSGSSTTNPSRP